MSPITVHPVQPGDYATLAHVEYAAFKDDEFSRVAFGATRTPEVLEARGIAMSKGPENKGESYRNMKAVRTDEDGKEEIVGFAMWGVVRVREGGVGIYGVGLEGKVEKGEGGSQKLSDDLFLPGDRAMARACGGGDYGSKLLSL